ncbi:MAG: iron-sulfur cluster loop [Candidatus Hermodarchaeota archaeon]
MKLADNQKKIIEELIKRGKKHSYREESFTSNSEADDFLTNLTEFPHAFVLGCVMDRQIKAERAWLIPYKIAQEIGGFEFSRFLALELDQTKKIFHSKGLHWFNDKMAENFYYAIQKIHFDYNDDASSIWKNNPSSATIIERFLEFRGVGPKIATMAANILVRKFRIPMKDYSNIDISPDVQVKRVFIRLGLIVESSNIKKTNADLIRCARELHPEYPGIFDLACWELGKTSCRPQDPKCDRCYLAEYCPKII